MRRILVDYARRRATQKHGGGAVREEITDFLGTDGRDLDTVLAVDEALDRLAAQHPTEAQVVELCTNKETGNVRLIHRFLQ